MKQFIIRLIYFFLIALIPLPVLFSLYFYFDPFKVLRPYSDYSNPYVVNNRDYVSTTMYIKNHKKNNYNSFILGSSRTLAFRPDSWKKYLSESDSPFMFDASGENVYGIYTKLNYLDSTNAEIKNVLIILCRDMSFRSEGNDTRHLYVKHPATSGEENLNFQYKFFKAYLDPNFLTYFYSYKILGGYKQFMAGYIEKRKITYDTLTNEINIIDQEIEVTQHPIEYYKKREKLFYERKGERIDTVQKITPVHVSMLIEAKRILEKNKTNYKVILCPLYDQVKYHPADQAILEKIFGKNLYDFTGKNSFTDDKMNYYEQSHFRTHIGDSILKIVYTPDGDMLH